MEKLNKEQFKAVTHKDCPLLIVAGAGTGKTTVITQKIAYMIEQGWARSDEILALDAPCIWLCKRFLNY